MFYKIMDEFDEEMRALAIIVAKNNDDIQYLKTMTNPELFNKMKKRDKRLRDLNMKEQDIDADGIIDYVVYNKENKPLYINGYGIKPKKGDALKREYYRQLALDNVRAYHPFVKNKNTKEIIWEKVYDEKEKKEILRPKVDEKVKKYITYEQWVREMNDPIKEGNIYKIPRDTNRTARQLIEQTFLKEAAEKYKNEILLQDPSLRKLLFNKTLNTFVSEAYSPSERKNKDKFKELVMNDLIDPIQVQAKQELMKKILDEKYKDLEEDRISGNIKKNTREKKQSKVLSKELSKKEIATNTSQKKKETPKQKEKEYYIPDYPVPNAELALRIRHPSLF